VNVYKVIDPFAKELVEILKISNKNKRKKAKKKLKKRQAAFQKSLSPYQIESDQSGQKYLSEIIKDPLSEAVKIARKFNHLDLKKSKFTKDLCLALIKLFLKTGKIMHYKLIL